MRERILPPALPEGSASNFTPAPWRMGRGSEVVADSTKGIYIRGAGDEDARQYYGGYLIAESISKGNARRVIACVNALAGVPTEVLEEEGLIGVLKAAGTHTANVDVAELVHLLTVIVEANEDVPCLPELIREKAKGILSKGQGE